VLDGQLGEAITTTQQFYPDLLENNLELLFVLRCRQFIEIVNGTEGESVPVDCSLPYLRRRLHVQSTCQPGSAVSSSAGTVNVGSTPSHRLFDTTRRLTTSSHTDADRLTNGAALNLSASSTDKNTLPRNGETRSASDADVLTEQDSDMDTSDNDERTLANGSSAPCCMNGSSELPRFDNLTTVFDSDYKDDVEDEDVDLETVMGKSVNCHVLKKQLTVFVQIGIFE